MLILYFFPMDITEKLTQILKQRKNSSPEDSYTAKLYTKGTDSILKKIGEEVTEYVMAVKDKEKAQIIYEAADLIFHLYVSLINEEIEPETVYKELERRFGVSGLEEKKNRKQK